MAPLRVCFWSTTFQADNHALADHLSRSPGFEVTVVTPNAGLLKREPAFSLQPFEGELLERCDDVLASLAGRSFDLLVVDNHLPKRALAPRLFVLWHGFGWRVDDLSTMRRELKKLVGDVTQENPNFGWQAFGDWDRCYRIRHSQLHEKNVVSLGSAYADWLVPRSSIRARFDKLAYQEHYRIDLKKPVVMVALTWHHQGSLGHWGDEETLLDSLVAKIRDEGGVCLVRMHDRHRYSATYQRLVEGLESRHAGHMMLKWKSESPDSLVDMLISDVCISNYSSLLNAFYYTERPTIHVDPHDASAATQRTHRMFWGRPRLKKVSRDQLWKLPPEEHGGLRASSFDDLLCHVENALSDPACCVAASRAFVARYITKADGDTCGRIEAHLREFVTR